MPSTMKRSPADPLIPFLLAAGLPAPEPEHRFHPTRRWRLDLAWPEHGRIALERHGGVWTGGRHTRGSGFSKDREKMNEAALCGWLVIEATTEQIASGEALAWLLRAFELRSSAMEREGSKNA